MKSKNLNKAVITSCFLAGCLEMYDFIIFGFLSPIIYKNYLSFLDENTGLIITYLLFAVGFIFRPIGAVLFGYIGDIFGRKRALVISVSMMGVSSLGMCLLPSYEILGVLSCYFIALMRVIQGVSVGGEYSGAMIYSIEHFNKKKIGQVCSLVLAGSSLGVLLSTIVSRLLQQPFMPEYAWRFAFLIGFGLSIIGYYIRRELTETPLFKEALRIKRNSLPLIEGIKELKLEFFSSILLAAANNVVFYYILIFIPNYLKSKNSEITINNSLVIGVLFLFVPLFGYLSDKKGRKEILTFTLPIIALYSCYFINLVTYETNQNIIIISTIIASILMASSAALSNIFALEIFPTQYRFSCGAVSYSIGAAIGGATPFICSLILSKFSNLLMTGVYIFSVVMVSWVFVLLLNKKEFYYRTNFIAENF